MYGIMGVESEEAREMKPTKKQREDLVKFYIRYNKGCIFSGKRLARSIGEHFGICVDPWMAADVLDYYSGCGIIRHIGFTNDGEAEYIVN